jgi:hypothetical protein
MNVFLSWSGARSKEVAEAFYDWLPTVINSVEPFISQRSIEKGVVGQNELSQSLEEINFGIICLTKENLHADWILYEAGALSKYQKESRVWTFLLDIKPTNISEPLSKFQHTSFEKNEVFQLLQSINRAVSPGRPLRDDLLEQIFNLNWERLKKSLSVIKAKESSTPEPVRNPSDINMEVLEVVRRQEKTSQNLIQQNEELTRSISRIVNQISRPALNPYSYSSQPVGVIGPGENALYQPSTSGIVSLATAGLHASSQSGIGIFGSTSQSFGSSTGLTPFEAVAQPHQQAGAFGLIGVNPQPFVSTRALTASEIAQPYQHVGLSGLMGVNPQPFVSARDSAPLSDLVRQFQPANPVMPSKKKVKEIKKTKK